MLIARPKWAVNVHCTTRETKLLVTTRDDDLLKARLPPEPHHPRALLTLCEGLALWHGSPLRTAVSADADAQDHCEHLFYAGGLVEPSSALVLLELELPRKRRDRRIRGRGLGDFRRLRLVRDEP